MTVRSAHAGKPGIPLLAVPQLHMFHAMRNTTTFGTTNAFAACKSLNERFPAGWSATSVAPAGNNPTIRIKTPGSRPVDLTVVWRNSIAPRDVANLVAASARAGLPFLVVTPFLSPRTRVTLQQAGANFADATGNVRLTIDDPALFILTHGADREPRASGLLAPVRVPRTLRSLKGPAAARVVRALCDFVPPYGVRALANLSETPLGTVSRVASFLEREALLERDSDQRITGVDWAALVATWVLDYSVARSNRVRTFLDPNGLSAAFAPRVADRLGSGIAGRYALTGSLGASGRSWIDEGGAVAPAPGAPPWPQFAPSRLAMIYTDDAEAAAHALGLAETDAANNVWLLQPFDDVVFDRNRFWIPDAGQVPVRATALSQVLADLATSPGRGPEEAATLTRWMRTAEPAWRARR